MDLNLKDKVILVTGGDGIVGRIGQTLVSALAKEGAIPLIIGSTTGDSAMKRSFGKWASMECSSKQM